MSKFHFFKNMIMASTLSLGVLAMVGCRTAEITVSVNKPGEFNLANVSKLAILDFNSVSSEPDSGVFEADAETIAIVQGRVAAAFAQNKTYSIARLDAEKIIQDHYLNGRVSPKSRFDGILYGRVWWQASPEIYGTYPKVMRLSTWDNVEYECKILGVKTTATAKVTTQTEEKLIMLPYRAWNATLMLALTAYKLDSKGNIGKLTETYAIGTLKYGIDNGQFASSYAPVDTKRAKRADGIQDSLPSWNTVLDSLATTALSSLATALQETGDHYTPETRRTENAEVIGYTQRGTENTGATRYGRRQVGNASATGYIQRGTGNIGATGYVQRKKETTGVTGYAHESKENIDVIAYVPEDTESTSVTGRFNPIKNTVTFPTELEAKFILADQLVAALIPKLMPVTTTFSIERSFEDPKLFYLIKNGAFKAGAEYCDICLSENANADIVKELKILQNIGETSDQSIYASLSGVTIGKETKKYIEDNIDYFFAKSLCEEASGHFAEALRGYRFIFHFDPSKESARGISRCLFALDMGNEVKKIKKDVKKSLKRANLE